MQKGRIGRLTVGEDDVRRTWKEYFEHLYNMVKIEYQFTVNMFVFKSGLRVISA